MLATLCTVRNAIGIYEHLTTAAILLGDLCELFKIVVPVVVKNYKLIVLFELSNKSVDISDLLTGCGDYREFGIRSSDILLKLGRIYDDLVKSVIRCFTQVIAENIVDISLGDGGVCKGISDRHISVIKKLYCIIYLSHSGISVQSTSTVPECGCKAAEAGSDLNSVMEIFGVLTQYVYKIEIELPMLIKIRNMELHFHKKNSF